MGLSKDEIVLICRGLTLLKASICRSIKTEANEDVSKIRQNEVIDIDRLSVRLSQGDLQ